MAKLASNVQALLTTAGRDVGEIKTILNEINGKLIPRVETVEVEKEVIKYVDRPVTVEKIVEREVIKNVAVPLASSNPNAGIYKLDIQLNTSDIETFVLPIPTQYQGLPLNVSIIKLSTKEVLYFKRSSNAGATLSFRPHYDFSSAFYAVNRYDFGVKFELFDESSQSELETLRISSYTLK